MRFKIRGTAMDCSREYIRAWLHASACVLAYHGKILPGEIKVRIAYMPGGDHGEWDAPKRTIWLHRRLDAEDMATTILHEVIHATCGSFGADTDEKCTSTLTARLRPDVKVLAQTLVDGTYKRAGYLAHTKLSYITDEDHYDSAEDDPIGVKDRYGKRKKEVA